MRLPEWDEETVRLFRGRWEALNRVSQPGTSEAPNGENASEENAFSELSPEDLLTGSSPFVQARLKYETLYEGLAHLLYTQPDNPPTERLIRHLDGETNRASYYAEVEFPKRRGGTRKLTIPRHPLKWIQRSLLLVLTHLFPRHKCAHGFERGKSIITHAKQHVGQRYVYTLDIKDFFPTITRARVFGMLQAYPIGASKPVARYLANLVTYDGRLPQGAPTSPILSNLLCRRLDSRLFKWARQNGYVYSRYADDLTFSTNKDSFPEADRTLIDNTIRDEGFEVNEDKRRLQPYYRRQMVTGLIVNEKVNIPREKLRGLRALLHNIKRYGWHSQLGRSSLFENVDEWRSYITASKDYDELRDIQEKQRKEHKLLNPAAALPHVRDANKLCEVVRGKVDFVGAVRGKDDAVYQRMLATFDQLSKRLENFQKQREEGEELARQEEKDEEKDAPVSHPEQTRKHYEQLSQRLESLDKEDISSSEFRESIAGWTSHSLEIAWFLNRTRGDDISQGDLRRELKRIAYVLDRTPVETSRFLRKLSDPHSFKSLLHPPMDHSVPPGTIVGKCIGHFEKMRYRIPNQLRSDTKKILDACTDFIETNSDHFPWPPAGQESSIQDKLREFKNDTRIDYGEFTELLEEYISDLKEAGSYQARSFSLPELGERFRTHLPSVLPALKKIIKSMAEHTQCDTVHIDMERVDTAAGFPEVVISIWDEGSVIDRKPDLQSLLTGDTGDALYHDPSGTGLRGYARWSLIAPFSNGHTFEFDVMRNQKSQSPAHDKGVMHRITFPQNWE